MNDDKAAHQMASRSVQQLFSQLTYVPNTLRETSVVIIFIHQHGRKIIKYKTK